MSKRSWQEKTWVILSIIVAIAMVILTIAPSLNF